jgi:diguanylate cyclase (GGDEF)-like protein
VIHGVLGPEDSLVRYGGDEFIILMPRRSQSDALEITRRLRQVLNQSVFLQDEGLEIKVTASYGIASLPDDAQDQEQLLLIADRAMFSSKGRGRDRIMLGRNLVLAGDE